MTCELSELRRDFFARCFEGAHHAVRSFLHRPDLVFAGNDVFCIGIEVAHDLVIPGGFTKTLEDFGVRPRAVIGDCYGNKLAFDESGELGIG